MARQSFYIIDGHAQIYRAYFAPFRDLTSPTGEPTKATYVFTQMLLNLVAQRKPDYLAMVIDSGDQSVFRKEIFPEYKSNRTSPPDDFFPQERRILQIVKDAGVPVFARPGYEADDLIATIARQLCDKDYDIVLVSKDKDLRQLINDCTRMYDVQSDRFTDAARVEQDCGYTPAQAIDIQSLMGDKIDNVPGIAGVGEKTAVELIKQFGNAEEAVRRWEQIKKPKLRESVKAFAAQLPITRQLVTLKADVEFDFDPEVCRFHGLNPTALRTHFQTLGFHALLKRLGIESDGAPATAPPQSTARPAFFNEGLFGNLPTHGAPAPASAQDEPAGPEPCTGEACDYRLINTDETFDAFVAELKTQKRFAFDTETDGLGAVTSNLIGLSFSWKPGQGFYVPVRGPAGCRMVDCDKVLRTLKPILEDESVRKVGHNIKYDALVMRKAGIDLRGVALDSMVAAFLLDPSRVQYGIDRLALELLNFRKVATVELLGKGKQQVTMDRIELERVARYASEDADIALRLADLLDKRLDTIAAIRKLADDLETPLVEVLAEMEHNGIAIDPRILREQSAVLGERVKALRGQIHKEAGLEFNIDSPKQLGDVLFNKLNLRVVKRTKTGPSTDVEVLEKLADVHAVPKLILEYRSLVKLKNTYLDNLEQYVNPVTRRVHGSFNQTGAATGRLSMSDPNLQNIPIRTDEGRRIRLAFVPGDPVNNVLLTADYSQIELRVLAHFTQEPALLRAFEADEDIHRAVAAEVFNVKLDEVSRVQRGYAKTINFGIIYGVSAFGLARRIEGMTVQAAQELITAYNRRFPNIAKFLQKCVMEAQSQGYVETILGRRRPLPDISSAVIALRNAAERMAINSVVQGSAADLIKRAMLDLHHRLKREKRPSRMLLQVHDELVFETSADEAESESAVVREEMIAAGKKLDLTVPLKVEVGWGKNWQEVK